MIEGVFGFMSWYISISTDSISPSPNSLGCPFESLNLLLCMWTWSKWSERPRRIVLVSLVKCHHVQTRIQKQLQTPKQGIRASGESLKSKETIQQGPEKNAVVQPAGHDKKVWMPLDFFNMCSCSVEVWYSSIETLVASLCHYFFSSTQKHN